MPSTQEERAARRESRRSNREENSTRPSLQGYQTESARLFGVSAQSSDDSSGLDNSYNNSYNSNSNKRRSGNLNRNLSGIEEGIDSSEDNNIHSMQPPGQDAAQGRSPRHHRVGPFKKDSDDDYCDDTEVGESSGLLATNPFADDAEDDDYSGESGSRKKRGGSAKPEREFQPAKLNMSGTSARSEGEDKDSFDVDDPPSKARSGNLVASALTTSSSGTMRTANTDAKALSRKNERDKFMEVLPDGNDRGDTTEDYGSPLYNETKPGPFDDSDRSYEQPRAYRPFANGSQGSSTGEHYASMQELLEEERSRSFANHKPSRFGGFLESFLGGKRTKRRKITLLMIVVLLCTAIGVCLYFVLGTGGGGGDKKGDVDSQNMQQIERPGPNIVPGPNMVGNASGTDSTFGMAENSTDDIFNFEPTFPGNSTVSGGDISVSSNVTNGPPVLTSSPAPTPFVSVPAPTPPTSGVANSTQPLDDSYQPTGSLTAAPSASNPPIVSPTNPPISVTVPSVQTDIGGVMTFSEPVPQDTEANLIIFLDALKKTIRAAVSPSLNAKDELIYVDIMSINGSTVDSLLQRRRSIRRRLQTGSSVAYEIVVLTSCDIPDCTDADTVANDVFTRVTNEISSSVSSGDFTSALEVNMISSSGGSVNYSSGVELGDFSEPEFTVLTDTAMADYGVNDTSYENSTIPVDVIAGNETEFIVSNATGDNAMAPDTCEFCEDGIPDPFLVVPDSGLPCSQLKEVVYNQDSGSSTCLSVRQSEGLCCPGSDTVSDTVDSNETIATNLTWSEDDIYDSNETTATNFTGWEDDLNDSNETMTTNLTGSEDDIFDSNETMTTNLTGSEDDIFDSNETMTTNLTGSEDDIFDSNETTATNFTGLEVDLNDSNETMTTNLTGSEDDIFDSNETMTINLTGWVDDLNDSNETTTTNLTGLDSEVDETDVDANNMTDPSIYDTSTIILPNMTLTGDYANFTDAFYDTDIDISNNTGGAEVMNSTLPDVDGTAMNATDASTAILDELSRPYTLSHELQGVAASASYGFSVAMSSDGNVLAVGAKDMTDASLGEVGAVRLYSLETSPPTLIQTLVNEYPYGEFGNSIGLSNDGNRLVVGARSENDQTGVVRVYERDSFGQWVLLGMPISGKSSGERAGWSVSISGDGSSVAVGAPKGGGSASGAVSTYRFEDGLNWAPYGTALEGVSEEAFGYATSLSYDGNLVAVGAPKAMNPEGASNAGKTSVYHLYGTEWLPLPGKELHGTSADGIDGTSIALSQDGSILVVGGKGRGNDDGVKNVGNCQIYEFGTDWELLHSMEGLTENERLGSSVAVSQNGNVVACGGEAAMYDGVGIGIVRVWNKATSMSSEVWPRNSDGGALFGSTLCLKEDGKILAVGAPGRNIVNVGKAGAVDVYEDFIN